MGGMAASTVMAIWLFDVPFRGSLLVLLLVSTLFMLAALGMGLLISTVTKNQFVAGQVAIIVAFLPAFLLSGFLFDITSMPVVVQGITHVVAARYFVSSLQTPVPGRRRMADRDGRRGGADGYGGLLPRADAAQDPQIAGLGAPAMWSRIRALSSRIPRRLARPKSRFVLIAPPLIQLLVFGYAATSTSTGWPPSSSTRTTAAGP
jgi:hypothetical protein